MNKENCVLAGVDEVGIGALAGPVVAAAVILNPELPISVSLIRKQAFRNQI